MLTEEQEDIITTLPIVDNIRVIAKAGTGKTTMAIELAKRYQEESKFSTLMLTFNRSLCDEVRKKTGKYNFIEVENYHTLCGKLYEQTCENDTKIKNCLIRDFKNQRYWDIIIIDEAQDMKSIHYELIVKILRSLNPKPKFLLMGDPFQRLYDAGVYYLEADAYFSEFYNPFENKHLSISFRISHEMADYINTNCSPNRFVEYARKTNWRFSDIEEKNIRDWWGAGIHASPSRKKEPQSLKITTFLNLSGTLEENYEKYENTAVLANSVKSASSPIVRIANSVSKKYGQPQLIDSKNSKKWSKNMRHYATTHQAKGMEFDLVCMPSFDEFPLKMKSYLLDPMLIFNLYYTAMTRAKKCLIISEISYGSSVFVTHMDSLHSEIENTKTYMSITSLLEFVPLLEKELYTVTEYGNLGNAINGDVIHICKGKNYTVDITRYIGTAVGYRVYELLDTERLQKYSASSPDEENRLNELNLETPTWVDLIRIAVCYDISETGHDFLWEQITPDLIEACISENFLNRCVENTLELIANIGQDFTAERYAGFITECDFFTRIYNETIRGRCDLCSRNSVVELKVSNKRDACEEHVLQALMYASVYRIQGKPIEDVYLFYTNQAKFYKISCNVSPQEFIYEILARKCKYTMAGKTTRKIQIKKVVKITPEKPK